MKMKTDSVKFEVDSVEKPKIYSHLKKFREINLKHDKAKLISHNFVREMNVRVKFSEFHTVRSKL